jgi:hypothetical protein
VLEGAKQLGNVSQACQLMDYSRQKRLSVQGTLRPRGEAVLQEISRRTPVLKKPDGRRDRAGIVALALEQLAWGQVRAPTI